MVTMGWRCRLHEAKLVEPPRDQEDVRQDATNQFLESRNEISR